MKIIPTILANDLKSFKTLFNIVVPLSDEIQVDLMDGRFVETTSIPLEDVPSVKKHKDKIFEAHLMVQEPIPCIPDLMRKGFKRMIFHYEAVFEEDLPLISHLCKKLNVEVMMAINPDTPVQKILPYAELFNGILFLGVHPGKNGASYVEVTPARIRELREANSTVLIQIDGGMNPETIKDVAAAGANRVNTGSYVGGSDNPKQALQEMYDALR